MNTLLDTIIAEAEFQELFESDIDVIERNEGEYEYSGSESEADDHSAMRDELEHEGPGIATSCGGQPVRTALHVAAQYVSLASQYLNELSSLPKSQVEAKWNAGPEKTWFGVFKKNRMINLRNRMWKIAQVLNDPLLVIDCNWSKEFFGLAYPGVPKITLGSCWRDAPGFHLRKVQTIIHEAAHIRGAVLGGDNIRRFYGIKSALTRAKKYPGIAIRTAENIGFYATCRVGSYKYKGELKFRCDPRGEIFCP